MSPWSCDRCDGRLIASVLQPVKQFAEFGPRGVKLWMAVLIVPEKFATADMTIEAAAVIPCTQHRSRAQLHQAPRAALPNARLSCRGRLKER